MSMSIYPGQTVEVEVYPRGLASALSVAAVAGATTITVYNASRWSAGQTLKIETGDPMLTTSEVVTIAGGGITGNVITLSAALGHGHSAGTPVARILDATMTGQTQTPDGTTTSLTLNNVSTGLYRGSFVPSVGGEHDIEVTSSGTLVAVNATTISVLTDRV